MNTHENRAGWTDERVEYLKTRWKEGVSGAQIAKELGGITRNAVIGKLHRLEASGRPKSPSRPACPRAPRPPKINQHVLKVESPNPKSLPPRPEPNPCALPPPEQRKTLFQLTKTTCSWPYGDPSVPASFFYCGAEKVDDPKIPYCAYHRGLGCGREQPRRRESQYKPSRLNLEASYN